MKRKTFITSIIAAGATGTLLAACTNPTATNDIKQDNNDIKQDNMESGLIIHSVYFWLKEGITQEEEQDFLKFFDVLKTVPGPKEVYIAKPASTNPRPVVDNSFSYFLLVTFDKMEDINTYETHPDHLKAAESFSKYWTKVEVKDSVLL